MIKIRNLHKSFGNFQVLKGIDLDIFEGESITIMGRSGTGKSVLVKHIVGLLKPNLGEIWVENIRVDKASEKEIMKIRRNFGYVFQMGALFDFYDVYKNLALVLVENGKKDKEFINQRVREVIKMVDLDERVLKLYPSELSGGMRKRVSIARAIIHSPKYIIYDEPTTGLDPITSDLINELIIRLNTELRTTTIAITHDLRSAIKISNRIVLLQNGYKVFDGSIEEALSTNIEEMKKFRDYYGVI
ncbi:MAG: ATP-binding cassette domain-containing protein [candidate division WOR-3 bacterium]|nr:ATP-binding cassette domain-containing protein [candidate division WOR-3 bacterium]MDW8150830.1 ATP-binding cassette domain-containing protein [candidate division WOR-3 bacterium]